MNYLTNHYRHQVEILSQKVALLENKLASLAAMRPENNVGPGMPTSPFGTPESAGPGGVNYPVVAGGAGGPGAPTSPFGTPESAGPGGVNYPGVAGNAGGPGQTPTFSGAVLGQLLASGNMNAVYQYLSQFYGNDIISMNALLANFGYNQQGGVDSQGGAGSQFSGAQLGQLLGQGNMNAVNQYLGQFGGQYPTQSGPAAVSTRANAPRSARRGAGRSATGR
jgi:hypothetical protein